MGRIPKSAQIQFWLGRLSQLGQTVSEFCKREQISVPSFYQWKRQMTQKVDSVTVDRKQRKRSSRSLPCGDGRAGFAELVVHSPQALVQASRPGGITISL